MDLFVMEAQAVGALLDDDHVEKLIIKRPGDGISTTAAELHVIHEDLQQIFVRDKEVYGFEDLRWRIVDRMFSCLEKLLVQFMWLNFMLESPRTRL